MAETILLPQQGNSVESVILLEWKVAVGDAVSVGSILCEVETDKATMEVESTADGTVLSLLAAAGDEVPVKTAICVVGEPGESTEPAPDSTESPDTTAPTSGATPGTSTATATATAAPAASEPQSAPGAGAPSAVTATAHTPATAVGGSGAGQSVSPRARMRATELGVDPTALAGSGPGGRVIERDVRAAAAHAPATRGAAGDPNRFSASPTGIGGRVTVADVAAAATPDQRGDSSSDVPRSGTVAAGPATVREERPVTGIRKVIAQRMLDSLQTTAQLTLHASADARALESLRRRFKAADEALGVQRITLNDMIMFTVARTLPEFPDLNAHFTGTTIQYFDGVDLGFAVDTPKGLLVPTVQGAASLSLRALSDRIKELASRAVDGKAAPDDLAPATFTVTNLGAFGIERFTPVLNPPQVAILGVSAIDLKAVRTPDGTVEHVPHIGLSLTIDHQAVDGAPGARFLQTLAQRIAALDVVLAL